MILMLQEAARMQILSQSPTDPAFVQDPYAFYDSARQQAGGMFHWDEYGVPCALSYAANWAILRDRRFGREAPAGLGPDKPAHQAGFWQIEDHSMLELEPPRHTRLRGLVVRAFTTRRIAGMEAEIAQLSNDLLDKAGPDEFDLIPTFASQLPVIIIARMLGIPEQNADQLLAWGHAMVGMYQARRSHEDEVAAAKAATAFSAFLTDYVAYRKTRPADDLITHLINAEQDGEKLSTAELIATCILLLNAGHEATVHSIGNGVRALLQGGFGAEVLDSANIDRTVEEILRFDPPLHMFQRWVYEPVEVGPHVLEPGTKVACLLAAANRDPGRWPDAAVFDPRRPQQTNVSFGAGVHFCLGAPLARLELRTALPVLFDRMPGLKLAAEPQFASTYHFHGLAALPVRR